MRHTLLVVTVLAICVASRAEAGLFGASDYNECVLDEMKGVTNDRVAYAIQTACRGKFPLAKRELTNEERAKVTLSNGTFRHLFELDSASASELARIAAEANDPKALARRVPNGLAFTVRNEHSTLTITSLTVNVSSSNDATQSVVVDCSIAPGAVERVDIAFSLETIEEFKWQLETAMGVEEPEARSWWQ